MKKSNTLEYRSVFNEFGFKKTVNTLIKDIQTIYTSENSPWIIGYSGGKDSTTVVQLVWQSLIELKPNKRTNPVYIISTDTRVENPVVTSWVRDTMDSMRQSAEKNKLPIYPHLLYPSIKDSYWVNLIGKGYPAPRPKFRWCTSRLKINPSNKFINSIVAKDGQAILVLGMRKAESSMRMRAMSLIENNLKEKVKDHYVHLTPNTELPGTYVYTPIEDWTNDDVWVYLFENHRNPWGNNNKDLSTMYKGATKDKECPFVAGSETPSCGDSRFGCWVCTLVDKDKSMLAMIQNDDEKLWMEPLLNFRDQLDIKNDRSRRDFRRMNGSLLMHNDRLVHGPYKEEERHKLLRLLIETQEIVIKKKPSDIVDFELITLEELNEIRKIWVEEKDETEDYLPKIYEDILGKPFPGEKYRNLIFGIDELKILRELCGENENLFRLCRKLINVERKYRMKAKRIGLFDELEKEIRKGFYDKEEVAEKIARDRKKAIENKSVQQTLPNF